MAKTVNERTDHLVSNRSNARHITAETLLFMYSSDLSGDVYFVFECGKTSNVLSFAALAEARGVSDSYEPKTTPIPTPTFEPRPSDLRRLRVGYQPGYLASSVRAECDALRLTLGPDAG